MHGATSQPNQVNLYNISLAFPYNISQAAVSLGFHSAGVGAGRIASVQITVNPIEGLLGLPFLYVTVDGTIPTPLHSDYVSIMLSGKISVVHALQFPLTCCSYGCRIAECADY